MKKILIADHVHAVMIQNFQNAGFVCDLLPDINQKQVDDIIENYFGIIINSKTKMYKNTLDKALNLNFIGRLGSGMEIIDTEYASTKGIASFSVPEGNRDAVAEHTIGMLLSLFNNLSRADREVKNQIWEREKNRGIELGGKTIGLIGYGNTGKAMAKKLSGFDVEVLAFDKYLKNYSDKYAKESSLEELFEKVDVLSFHIPLTDETKYFCDKKLIKKFKKSIYLANTSRGGILNLEEIIFLIENKKILGACLDVFENEKPNTFNMYEKNMYSKLARLNAVLLSPHVAGWTKESKYKIGDLLSKKIIKFVNTMS